MYDFDILQPLIKVIAWPSTTDKQAPTMSDEPAVILVVDDERSVLGLVSMQLQRKGYTVLVAGSGKEALSMLESRADEISRPCRLRHTRHLGSRAG